MSRRFFTINATDLRVVLGSKKNGNCNPLDAVHCVFESIWRRYYPEVFDHNYVHAPLPLPKPIELVLSSSSSSSSSSRIAQRCVVSRFDGERFTFYQRTMYDRLAMLYREQQQQKKYSFSSRRLAQNMARHNGVLFEAQVLEWFHSVLWPLMHKSQTKATVNAGGGGGVSNELALVHDAVTTSTMHYRFVDFVRSPADGLYWWLCGKIDGKLVAQHSCFRTLSSSTSSSSATPRLQVIEAKMHSQLYEREAELLQLLAYLFLLKVESGYLVQSSMACGEKEGDVDVNMMATHVQSDDLLWWRWIVPRMNQILYTIDWLSRHQIAAKAYFRLGSFERDSYIENLLQSVAVMRMPSRCRIPDRKVVQS